MPDRSNHKDVQVILQKIQQGGMQYIASVSKSFKTAESGFAFAMTARELCMALDGQDYSDEIVQDSITEMREIAQQALDGAQLTTNMFDANRREFTEVRRGHADKSPSNTISVDPNQHSRYS
jgi:hypothetical protein